MQRKTAMMISGAVTAFVLMLVVGLVFGASSTPAVAKTTALSSPVSAPPPVANANSTDVAALQKQVQQDQAVINQYQTAVGQYQSQLQQYKDQLTKAYSDLQTAYSQINTLQSAQSNQGRLGRFRGEGGGTGGARSGVPGFFGGGDD